MENQLPKFSTSAFLIIIVSVTDTPYFIKYPLLTVAIISLGLEIYKSCKKRESTVPSNEHKGRK